MKPAILFLFLIFLATAVNAYDCSVLGSECKALDQVDENFIANLIYTNSSYADYLFIDIIFVLMGSLNDAILSASFATSYSTPERSKRIPPLMGPAMPAMA